MRTDPEEKVKRIYDWDAQPRQRNHTAADLRDMKGKRRLTQTTTNTAKEAAAARDAHALAVLHAPERRMADERRRALSDFCGAVRDGTFPGPAETADMPEDELDRFLKQVDA